MCVSQVNFFFFFFLTNLTNIYRITLTIYIDWQIFGWYYIWLRLCISRKNLELCAFQETRRRNPKWPSIWLPFSGQKKTSKCCCICFHGTYNQREFCTIWSAFMSQIWRLATISIMKKYANETSWKFPWHTAWSWSLSLKAWKSKEKSRHSLTHLWCTQ